MQEEASSEGKVPYIATTAGIVRTATMHEDPEKSQTENQVCDRLCFNCYIIISILLLFMKYV